MNVTELEARVNALESELQNNINSLWALICSLHVFFMQAGFALIEAGQCRKHLLFLILKNTMDVVTVGTMWWAFGYCIAFGGSDDSNGNSFSGFDVDYLFHIPDDQGVRWFFFFVYVSASATIVSGAMAERTKFLAYAIFSMFGGFIVFPIVVHWVWSPTGFLSAFNADAPLPTIDYAGSGVVHFAGGIAAFVGAAMVGPRRGVQVGRRKKNAVRDISDRSAIPIALAKTKSFIARRMSVIAGEEFQNIPTSDPEFSTAKNISSKAAARRNLAAVDDDGKAHKHHGSDLHAQTGVKLTLQALGTFILWYAWFAFNGGSTQAFTNGMEDIASHAVVNTLLGASGAASACLVFSRAIYGRYMVDMVLNGLLGGLVAVTACCGLTTTYAAFLVGAAAGVVYIYSAALVRYVGVDDPVDAVAVHGFCGLFGFLAAPLISREEMVVSFYGASNGASKFATGYDRWAYFGHQLGAALIIGLWIASLSIGAFKALEIVLGTIRDDVFMHIDNRSIDQKKSLERQSSFEWDTDEPDVCIVFTDIEGSTVLWETDPDSTEDAIDMHHEIARESIAMHKGYEIKTEGDAFMVAFRNPRDAVKWAVHFQLELLRAPWPRAIYSLFHGRIETEQVYVKEGDKPELHHMDSSSTIGGAEDVIERVIYRGLRIRIGMHYDKAKCKRDPTTKRMDFYGPMVNRAARISGLARGGQTLISTEVLSAIVGMQLGSTVVGVGGKAQSEGVSLMSGKAMEEQAGKQSATTASPVRPFNHLGQQADGPSDMELQSCSSLGGSAERDGSASSYNVLELLKQNGQTGFEVPLDGEGIKIAFVGSQKVKGIAEEVELWMVHPTALSGRGFARPRP